MSVKRYEVNGPSSVFEDANGSLVDYEDYAALEARCAALAAENAGLKSAIEKHADSYIMCGYCRTERDGKNDDVCEVLDSTPATEAFLAEVRALAAELSAVEEIHNEAVFITDDHYEQCPPEVQKIIRSLAVMQIPAYQAFLAEVRAQGVEMFADSLLCPDLDDAIRDFAAQLRKGVI